MRTDAAPVVRQGGLMHAASSVSALPEQLAVAVGPRPDQRDEARARLRGAGASVVLARPGDAVSGFGLSVAGLVEWAGWAVRDDVGPFCVLIGGVGSQSLAPITPGLRRARRAPERVCVVSRPGDRRRVPLTAALTAYAALLRTRSPATWRALDALDLADNNAVAAAQLLGCSPQAVRAHRARSHVAITREFPLLFEALLAQ